MISFFGISVVVIVVVIVSAVVVDAVVVFSDDYGDSGQVLVVYVEIIYVLMLFRYLIRSAKEDTQVSRLELDVHAENEGAIRSVWLRPDVISCVMSTRKMRAPSGLF